jgi:hypothetical protein
MRQALLDHQRLGAGLMRPVTEAGSQAVHGDLLVARGAQQAQQQDIGQRLARLAADEEKPSPASSPSRGRITQQSERRRRQRHPMLDAGPHALAWDGPQLGVHVDL